ncbi:winged helix-turn-helix domain-containing protein [Streptomyces sp. CT34]|uniref:winged helix-turn-helix domain-containing protein n=1 Tax=Streptomyces sp. CT34 TaxID=1553907 RepID=UPI0007C67150|nr:winged helix-turn-helix domain-containing protein [Streptomyces sp. CT34]
MSADLREDWIRLPTRNEDMQARIATLQARNVGHCAPQVEPNGVIRRGSRTVTVSPTEAELVRLLTVNFGEVVPRESLRKRLCQDNRHASRNALDLHIMRIRRRITPLRLEIHTAWGRGYTLTTCDGGDGDAALVGQRLPGGTDPERHEPAVANRSHPAGSSAARNTAFGDADHHTSRVAESLGV